MIPTDRVGVTVRSLLAWVGDAGIIQLAEQPCAAIRTFTEKRGHAVITSGAVGAGSTGAVINVLTAVVSSPAVDTDTLVTAISIVTCAAVLARIGHQLAFVNIISAKLTCKLWFTLAVISVHSINTGASVLALMTWTVIDVDVAVYPSKTWYTRTFVAGVSFLEAGPSIKAW